MILAAYLSLLRPLLIAFNTLAHGDVWAALWQTSGGHGRNLDPGMPIYPYADHKESLKAALTWSQQ